MLIQNCLISNIDDVLRNRKIVVFGAGSWIKAIESPIFEPYADSIDYIVDNGSPKKIVLFNRIYITDSPNKLKEDKGCVIILTSPLFMYDMFIQLIDMNLSDEFSCVSLPFLVIQSPHSDDRFPENRRKKKSIPKVIHSFWFSGEDKPYEYQRCVDSWKNNLQDYKIIEWNKDNYEWGENAFFKRAIELKMWAFATDYARLDVVYRFGGVYLDMDVEINKSITELLDYDAFFAFSNNAFIDLAVFAATPSFHVVKTLMDLYGSFDAPNTREEFVKYYQPAMVRNTFREMGVRFDGTLQLIDDILICPRIYFVPIDNVVYEDVQDDKYTYGIHHDNFGWSIGSDSFRKKKIVDNRRLKNIFNSYKSDKEIDLCSIGR